MRQHTAEGPGAQDLFEGARQAVTELENRADRQLGASKKIVGGGAVNYGELLAVDPTPGVLTVTLPFAKSADVDKSVIIKNNSASTNNITILAAGNDTIDGSSTLVVGVARSSRTLKVIAQGEWVVIASV
jgi:hypothetical protein